MERLENYDSQGIGDIGNMTLENMIVENGCCFLVVDVDGNKKMVDRCGITGIYTHFEYISVPYALQYYYSLIVYIRSRGHLSNAQIGKFRQCSA